MPAFVALIGAPRSGTTWLQTLVGSHDAFVSPQETNLFSRYVAPLAARWAWEARGTLEERQHRRFAGLGAVLTQSQFDDEVGAFVASVIRSVAKLKPGASTVLEKTPSHSLHVELIARYVPGARFVHIVRDGRDVAASLVAASQGWGAAWGAPNTVGAAAREWRTYLESARRARALGPYHELRYEDLLGDSAPEVLRDAFAFCGIEMSAGDARARLERFAIDRQRDGERGIVMGGEAAQYPIAADEPEGFYRRGHSGGWRSWSATERVACDVQAGRLLRSLGYVADDTWLGARREVWLARRSLALQRQVARLEGAAGSRLTKRAARRAR